MNVAVSLPAPDQIFAVKVIVVVMTGAAGTAYGAEHKIYAISLHIPSVNRTPFRFWVESEGGSNFTALVLLIELERVYAHDWYLTGLSIRSGFE